MTQTGQSIASELQMMQDKLAALKASTKQQTEAATAMSVPTPTNLPVPSLTDNPNVPRDMLALATALDSVTVPKFATTAARDAAYAAGATFTLCYVLDVVYRRRANAWVALADTSDLSHRPVSLGSATVAGANFPAGGGTLGYTGSINVAAVAYPRLVAVSFSGMSTILPSGTVTFVLRNITTEVDRAQVDAQGVIGRGVYYDVVAANATRAYQMVGTATSAATITADTRMSFMKAYSLGSM